MLLNIYDKMLQWKYYKDNDKDETKTKNCSHY